jgi:SET domain-containing protein
MNKTLEQPTVSWVTPKARLMQSGIGGKGLFAISAIQKGEKVVIWGGIYVNKEQAERVIREGKLVMQWDDDLFSVEGGDDDIGYAVNHSCNANLWMVDAYTLVARLDIEAGQELTVDYALFEAEEDYISAWECNCGASNCRARITGKDWRLPEIQERYANHFSPLINKRISKR